MPTFSSWTEVRGAIDNNHNSHCSLPSQMERTMNIIEKEPEWCQGNAALAGWKLLYENTQTHPLCIYCAHKDPLFRVSTAAVKQNVMRNEISELSRNFDSLYKKHGGRSRCWVKKDFIAWFLKTEAQDSYPWNFSVLLSDKLSSALMDFFAAVGDFSIAVFYSKAKRVLVYMGQKEIKDKVFCIDGESGLLITPSSGVFANKAQFKNITSQTGWLWTSPISTTIPETVTELKNKITTHAALPNLTRHELLGWIWRSQFFDNK